MLSSLSIRAASGKLKSKRCCANKASPEKIDWAPKISFSELVAEVVRRPEER
jgi:hypothetical protein